MTTLRRAVFLILLAGMLGTGAELILLSHTEDSRQWIPVILLLLGLLTSAWHWARPSSSSIRVLKMILLGFVASGFAGMYFHYQGSAEFKLESNPSLRGWSLFREAIRNQAPPFLAPGAMIYLGLLGLVFTRRHPALGKSKEEGE
ncbi:MAG TPA: hypothetical protein VFN20_09615 [Candidatus Acidoferrum sp.]|nr:hypothetical protein [Candidatus Acidoferrum sp.]